MVSKKLKVAWFSELISDDSLSAYFSRTLLPHLKDKFDITLYHNSFEKFQDFKTEHYLKAFENNKKEEFDIFFYQLEDGNKFNFIRSHIGLVPGITYFHHFNLSTYGPEPLLNSPYTDIVGKFNSVSSDWPDRRKKYKPKGPAAFREAMLSPVAVFSTPQSLNEYRHQIKETIGQSDKKQLNAFYLPYPVEDSESNRNIENSALKIAFIGTTRIENRAHKVFSALKDLKSSYSLKWMMQAQERTQAEELLKEYGIESVELLLENSPESWRKIVSQADVAIHMLFSVYGHNQPYLGISLSEGCTSLVTNFASNETLPDNVVVKIQPGDTESSQIREAIDAIANEKQLANAELLKRYSKDHFDPQQIAAELSSIFQRRADFLKEINFKWQKILSAAKQSLIVESEGFLNNDYSINPALKPFFEELGWQ